LECVGGDHGPGQVEVAKQRLEARHLAGGAVDLALGQHLTTGVLHGRQQMDLTAIAAGAPQRLAIHRDRPSMSMLVRTLSVGQPCADRPGQGLSIQAG
jgi:hypothetical protein